MDNRNISLVIGDQTLHIEYSPSKGKQVANELKPDMTDPVAAMDFTITLLVNAIVKWDIFADDGNSIPITEESLLSLPYSLVDQIAHALIADTKKLYS